MRAGAGNSPSPLGDGVGRLTIAVVTVVVELGLLTATTLGAAPGLHEVIIVVLTFEVVMEVGSGVAC